MVEAVRILCVHLCQNGGSHEDSVNGNRISNIVKIEKDPKFVCSLSIVKCLKMVAVKEKKAPKKKKWKICKASAIRLPIQ